MKQDHGYLPLFSAKMAFALLGACETGQLSAEAEEYAVDALRHYNSDWKWFPEPLPGLGHLDDFIYLLSAMWVCQESHFPKPTAGELELLPKRLNIFFRRRAKAQIEVASQPDNTEEAITAPQENTPEAAQEQDDKSRSRAKDTKTNTPPPTKKARPPALNKPENPSVSFQ